jgi:hypothetical protein
MIRSRRLCKSFSNQTFIKINKIYNLIALRKKKIFVTDSLIHVNTGTMLRLSLNHLRSEIQMFVCWAGIVYRQKFGSVIVSDLLKIINSLMIGKII